MTHEELKEKVIECYTTKPLMFEVGIRKEEDLKIILELLAVFKNSPEPLTVRRADYLLDKTKKILEYLLLNNITI